MQIPILAILLSLSLASATRTYSRSDSDYKAKNGLRTKSNNIDLMKLRGPLAPQMEVSLQIGGLKLKSVKPTTTSYDTASSYDSTKTSQTQTSTAPTQATQDQKTGSSQSSSSSGSNNTANPKTQKQNMQSASLHILKAALTHVQQLIGNQML